MTSELTVRETVDVQALMLPTTGGSIAEVLAEFSERHHQFRELFKAQLIEGEHYGTPPGIRRSDADPKQWVARPSLYQAGADKAMLLMNVRPEFAVDMDAWTQAGSKVGTYCIKCRLYSRDSGKIIGEGMGAGSIGGRSKFDENGALKMAQKRAKVSAVLNSFGLSEMFSQDLEDMDQKDPHDAADRNPDAPTTRPRTDRVSKQECGELFQQWKATRGDMPTTPINFERWVNAVTGMETGNIKDANSWMRADFQKCEADLSKTEASR